jgi:hypothetical protein
VIEENGWHNDFKVTYISEKERVKEIEEAQNSLESGSRQFSFYNIMPSSAETSAITRLRIDTFYNFVTYLSEVSDFRNVTYSIIDQLQIVETSEDVFTISNLITRTLSNIMGVSDCNDAEVILRTHAESLIKNNCLYWHIDKSHSEIRQNIDIDDRPFGYKETQPLYLYVLRGEKTLFYPATDTQKAEFNKLANESDFIYGYHGSACQSEDNINQLLDYNLAISAPENYGSVHMAGKDGAIHAVPPYSSNGRLLIMITPFDCEDH